MKVFISWSGDYSREVAEKLRVWIPSVIQSVEPFFSQNDIGKGENWNNVLSKELDECNFGIICLTPENVTAPWIHFEAGALAKTLDSRLSSVMFGINPSDVKGPLSRFQNTKFEREDFFKLLQAINGASDHPLKPEILSHSFDAFWGQLDKEIGSIIKKYKATAKEPKVPSKINDSEALQEILSIVRKMSSSTHSNKGAVMEGIAPPRTSTNSVDWGSPITLNFSLKKRFPTEPLNDETRQALSRLQPIPIFITAISSLEEEGESSFSIVTFKDNARVIMGTLFNLPDLHVEIAFS